MMPLDRSGSTLRDVFGLHGREALVTGAGSGLAQVIARTMAAAGASVLVADSEGGEAERVAASIREAGGDAQSAAADLTEESAIIHLLNEYDASCQGIDIVVLGATIQGGVPALDMTAEQWDRAFAVNLRGAFLTAREAIRHMLVRGRGGRIIALSTIGSQHPVLHGNVAYSASKAGLNQMCRNLALEHAGDGILVNAILPGAMPGNAPKMVGAIAPSGPGAVAQRHLSGQGDPADVGWLATYLASPAGRYITGQTLVIDGGFSVG